LVPFSEVVEVTAHGGGHRLAVRDVNYGTATVLDADVVILATGFRDFGAGVDDEPRHPLLDGLDDRLEVDDEGLPVVARDYSVRVRPRREGAPALRVYLNGLCEASHGMGDAGALAVLSARSADIAGSIMRYASGAGRERRVTAEAVQ